MKAWRNKLESLPARVLLIGLTVLLGLSIGFVANRTLLRKKPADPKPKTVTQLIRDLQRQETMFGKVRQDVWSVLPGVVRKHLHRLAPASAASARCNAVVALGNLRSGASDAIPALTGLLRDLDPNVRQAVVQTLSNVGPAAQSAVPELIRLFMETATNAPAGAFSAAWRNQVPSALAAIAPQDPAVIDALKMALAETGLVPQLAVQALGTIASETEQAVAVLVQALRTSGVPLKWTIIEQLGHPKVRRRVALEALIEELEKRDPRTERSVVETLPRFGPDAAAAVPCLIRLFREIRNPRPEESTDAQTGAMAAPQSDRGGAMPLRPLPSSPRLSPEEVLGVFGWIGPGASNAIPLLAEEYLNRTNRLRVAAARARWRIDRAAAEVLPVLGEGLKTGDLGTRRWIVSILGEIGGGALPALQEALRDREAQIRVAALTSLAKCGLGPATILPFFEQSLDDPDKEVRFEAIRSLGQLGPNAMASVPKLEAMLADPSLSVRRSVEKALRAIQPGNGERPAARP